MPQVPELFDQEIRILQLCNRMILWVQTKLAFLTFYRLKEVMKSKCASMEKLLIIRRNFLIGKWKICSTDKKSKIPTEC
jgi:hypothetical protein